MKYSVIMPYHNRAVQLRNTLLSFAYHYASRSDYEIIIVEDIKTSDNPQDAVSSVLGLPISVIKAGAPGEYNPSRLFNVGAANAQGDYLILTNPECFHKTDILSGMDSIFSIHPLAYIVCGCLSLANKPEMINRFEDLQPKVHMWYQHTQFRNVLYHFCSALWRQTFHDIGGFDERYAQGIGYDDNAFLNRVQRASIQIIPRDDLLVYHQRHEKLADIMPRSSYMQKLRRNRALFEGEKRRNG